MPLTRSTLTHSAKLIVVPRAMETSSLAAIVLLSLFVVCVEADYRLEIRLFRYNNPTHQCAECGPGGSPGCCDGDRNGSCSENARCNNMFIFCLRPLETSNLDFTFCPLGENSTRIISSGDNLEFGLGGQTVSGLPNPLVFTGDRWPGGVQLYAGVRDANDRSLDLAKLVDRFTIDQNITVGENLSTPTNHSGEFNFGHFVLGFRVTCTENFFGSDCATFCVERDDELGHFTCDSEGNIVCREGYTGENCTIDLDRCGHTTPCENGATCNNTGPDQYECLCAAGFEGVNCESETDECDPNPCMNGGICTDLDASYSCSCVNGFTGRDCEVMINSCQGVDCSENGQCRASLSSFTCVCDPGYSGELCEIRVSTRTTTPSGTPAVGSSDNNTAIVAGAVVGAYVGALLIALLVIAVMALTFIKHRKTKPEESVADDASQSSSEVASPGDNPTYGLPEVTSPLAVPESFANTAATNGGPNDSIERDFDNPIYASNELPNNEYASPNRHTYATLEPGRGSYDHLENAWQQYMEQLPQSSSFNGLKEFIQNLDYEDI